MSESEMRDELITNFLTNRMAMGEAEKFLELVERNPDLYEELAAHKLAFDFFNPENTDQQLNLPESAYNRSILERVMAIQESNEMIRLKDHLSEVVKENHGTPLAVKLRPALLAAAAAVTVFLCVVWLLNQSPEASEVYARYDDSFNPRLITERSAEETENVTILFREGKYQAFLESTVKHKGFAADSDPDLLLYAGIAYRKTGQLEESRENLLAYLALSPLDAHLAHWHLGMTSYRLDNVGEAAYHFRKAAETENFYGASAAKEFLRALEDR